MKIPSYSSIYNVGHKALGDFLFNPVIVEEKVDGSQFSFGILGGELCARSKGADLYFDNPEKMFAKALEVVKGLEPLLKPEWIYRGEYLQKPKHNTLTYTRTPNSFIVLYDIESPEKWLSPEEKAQEATRIGLEVIPHLYEGVVTLEITKELLDRESFLGGVKIEGVVLKPVGYSIYGPDKKVMMAKHVSEAFKEIHGGEWRKTNPTQGDIVQQLVTRYKTEPRWNKAVQHVRESGELENSPRDIGKLMKALQEDLRKECEDDLKQKLFDHFSQQVFRGATGGFAEWYKEKLLKESFEVTSPIAE